VLAGADAVLVQKAAQAEQLAVGGGELGFEVADRGAAGVTFLAEFGCEDVHDVVLLRGCGLCGDTAGGAGGLLSAELVDALSQFGAGVEEIDADPGGPGNRPEVDVLLFPDDVAAWRLDWAARRRASARRCAAEPPDCRETVTVMIRAAFW
jgi:hypothetical protein